MIDKKSSRPKLVKGPLVSLIKRPVVTPGDQSTKGWNNAVAKWGTSHSSAVPLLKLTTCPSPSKFWSRGQKKAIPLSFHIREAVSEKIKEQISKIVPVLKDEEVKLGRDGKPSPAKTQAAGDIGS